MLTDCKNHRLREEKGVTNVQKCPPKKRPKTIERLCEFIRSKLIRWTMNKFGCNGKMTDSWNLKTPCL